jgi:agmatinase
LSSHQRESKAADSGSPNARARRELGGGGLPGHPAEVLTRRQRSGKTITVNEQAPGPAGPIDASRVPRYAGIATFGRLPQLSAVGSADVAVLGVPFDSRVSYRPCARFGPAAVRKANRLLRPYHPGLDVEPFATQQVADAGDLACKPVDIAEAIAAVYTGAARFVDDGTRLVSLGGDHTVALPLLRAVAGRHGPPALLHFDAHLDTWDTYFGARYTHGTPFRRAVEKRLLDLDALSQVGIRGPLYGRSDLREDECMGFGILTAMDVMSQGVGTVSSALRERAGRGRPVYVSVDVDVLDPAYAPGPARRKPAGCLAGSCSPSCEAWPGSGSSRRTLSRLPLPMTMPTSRRWLPAMWLTS